MVRYLLRGLVIATVGDFGASRGHKVLRAWIERRGGVWSREITSAITHLVCTKEAFKQQGTIVRAVQMLKNIPIVTYDWLEESLMLGCLLPVHDYIVATIIANDWKAKRIRKLIKKITLLRGIEKFEKECQDINQQLSTDRYQIHRDSTGFAFNATLVRVNILNNTNERYILKLCETIEVPKYYACLSIHHKPGSSTASTPTTEKTTLAPKLSDFATAFAAFENAFCVRTRIPWCAREEQPRVGLEGAFAYVRPKPGEPVGLTLRDVCNMVGWS